MLTTIIVTYFFGSYILANKIFNELTESFEYIDLINKRGTCLYDTYTFVIETYG